jgi:putative hydrolase of the HAD superfamily
MSNWPVSSTTSWESYVAVEAVIFDWGGTLTPWRTIDAYEEWGALARVAAPDRVEAATDALVRASTTVWARSRDEHRSSTLEEVCVLADLRYDPEHWSDYRAFWEHATFVDPDVPDLFAALRAERIKIGVLSNTLWPTTWHEEIFARDGIDHLIDGAVYTSAIEWTKPAPEAFHAAMGAVDAVDPAACVFVGDRLFDDIWGARNAGMRAIHLPHSDIPAEQIGHSLGEPDAVIQRLADVPEAIAHWR